MRRANVKIAVLKEVIDKLYKGENVDVEGMLGVGDEREERSWEEGMLFGLKFLLGHIFRGGFRDIFMSSF